MAEIGSVKMRKPDGRVSLIEVSTTEKGSVDIIFRRTSEGEALVRLPAYAAQRSEVSRSPASRVGQRPARGDGKALVFARPRHQRRCDPCYKSAW